MRRLVLGAVLLLALAAGVALVWAERAVAVEGPAGEAGAPRIVEVPRGANARQVGHLLEEAGLIRSHLLWRYLILRRGGLHVMAGRFSLKPGDSMKSLAAALERPPLPEDEPFTVVEGWRIRDTDAALSAAGFARPDDYARSTNELSAYRTSFQVLSSSLEGYLYPETYRLPRDASSVRTLIQRQLDAFGARVIEPHRDDIAKSRRSIVDLVKMASLLEKEEPDPEQRHVVAGILWNRIDRGMPLGVDATSRYSLAQWNDEPAFRKVLGDASDPYDTRNHKGLPPTPIGAISEASFEAALHPAATDFLYYLHDDERRLHPSRTLKEHEALRRRYGVH